MSWLIFSLLSALFLSVSNVLQRVLMKDEKSDAYTYSIAFQFLAAVIVLVFSLAKGFRMPPVLDQPLNYLMLAVLYGLGTVFIFKALQYLESAEVTIITSIRSFVTIVTAIVLLRESFSITNVLGALLILSAVILVTKKREGFVLNKGAFYALGMGVCYGFAVTNDRFLITTSVDTLSYATVSFVLPGLFIVAIKPTALRGITTFLKGKVLRNMLLMSLLYALAAMSYFTAFEKGANASQMAPIQQSSVILTVILAAIFLGERKHLVKKCFGAMLVFIGVLLLK